MSRCHCRNRPRLAQRRTRRGRGGLGRAGQRRHGDHHRAGGTDDGDLGTSAAKVERGLSEADSGAGVVVLPDLGSAVLTVRAVLEDYGDAESVLLADAPFVEGAVAATVTAAAGGDIKAVAAAAEEARHVRKL